MGNIKDKINWILEIIHESKTLRYTQFILNTLVFFSLFVSGVIIITINKILGSIILLTMALFLVLNKNDRK
jgi:hypothetical protein